MPSTATRSNSPWLTTLTEWSVFFGSISPLSDARAIPAFNVGIQVEAALTFLARRDATGNERSALRRDDSPEGIERIVTRTFAPRPSSCSSADGTVPQG